MNQIDRRLSRLEQEIEDALRQQEPKAERDARFAAAAVELSGTMEQEHIRRINAYAGWDSAEGPCPDAAAGHLWSVALGLLNRATNERPGPRLALPGAVAEVLMAERVWLEDSCADCRLQLPYARRWGLDSVTVTYWTEGRYFPGPCPDCGSPRRTRRTVPAGFESGGIIDQVRQRRAG